MKEIIVSPSSDNLGIIKKTVWIDGAAQEIELWLNNGDDPNEYYEVYLMGGETTYCVSGINYDRILKAIESGAKFIKINKDLINVNTIKRFREVK